MFMFQNRFVTEPRRGGIQVAASITDC